MSETSPTLRSSVAKLVRRELARLGFLLTYEYRVVLQDGAFLELQAVRKAAGLPDLARCLARPGAAGYAPRYRLGSTVLVAFVEGDPSRPFVAFGPEVGSATPLGVAIDADEINMGDDFGVVVREGDSITVTSTSVPPVVVSGVVAVTSPTAIPPVPKSKVRA